VDVLQGLRDPLAGLGGDPLGACTDPLAEIEV
jgi:hypothetical protein